MVNYKQLKENYIKKLIKEEPEMNVLFVDNKNNNRWPHEKKITELNQEERNQ